VNAGVDAGMNSGANNSEAKSAGAVSGAPASHHRHVHDRHNTVQEAVAGAVVNNKIFSNAAKMPKMYIYMFLGFTIILGWLLFQIIQSIMIEDIVSSAVPSSPSEQESDFFASLPIKSSSIAYLPSPLEGGAQENSANSSNSVNSVAALPSSSQSSLAVRANRSSWVVVVALTPDYQEEELVFSSVMREGDVLNVPKHDLLFMKTGNAEALDIMIDGEVFVVEGFSNFSQYLLLDKEKIKAGTAAAEALELVKNLPKKSFFAFN
jgi:hypothetical protein